MDDKVVKSPSIAFACHAHGRDERGFVLPLTLIIIALLTVLSMGISQMARHAVNDARQRRDFYENELALRDAAQWALYQLLAGTPKFRTVRAGRLILPIDGRPVRWQGITVRVQDGAGLMGLGIYRQQPFRQLLQQLTNKTQAETIAARLGDWIDANQRTRFRGMEAADYLKAGLPMQPRNAPLRTLDELLEVPGVTSALYNGRHGKPGLRDFLLAGGSDHFNLATAPVLLVGPMLGFKGDKLRQVLALRRKGDWDLLRRLVGYNVAFNDSPPFTPGFQFRMIIRDANGATARALFRLTPDKEVPYERMLWQYPDHGRG